MAKPLKLKSKKKAGFSLLPLKLMGGFKQGFFYSLPYILCLIAAGLLFGSVIVYAVNSPTFRLGEVRVLNIGTLTPEQAFDFCDLKKGENLITLDLVGVQQVIKRRHPEFKEVKVRRVLPNRIEVALKRRTPFAQVAFSNFLQVDRDLVILPASSPTPFRNLTVIRGVAMPREGLVVGSSLKDPSVLKAVKLAEVIKQSNVLRKRVLTAVDVTDPRNFSLWVENDLEIRIGGNHFMERLKILDQTIRAVDLDPAKIRYIDLRFDDVVIGPR